MENALSFIFFSRISSYFSFILSFSFFLNRNPTNQIVWFGMNLMKEGQINPPHKAGEGESLIKQTGAF